MLKKHYIGVFINLKEAFDTVNYQLLCNENIIFGIRGLAFKWLNSYLDNRKEFMSIHKFKSDVRNISCGVRHG